jgi:hypothetical protein
MIDPQKEGYYVKRMGFYQSASLQPEPVRNPA